MTWTTFDKALVAGVGMALLVLNNLVGFNFSPNVHWGINLGIAVLTPMAVYLKANKPV